MEKHPKFLPEPYPLSPEELAAVLAKLKADFSAADLQKFTEIEEHIPFERVIKEIEDLHQSR